MPFLIFTAAMLFLVWGAILVPRLSLLVLCAVYLLTASAYGYEIFHFDVAGITLSLDRILLVFLVAAYFIQSRRGLTAKRDMPASERLLLAFLAILLINTFTHNWQRVSTDQVPILPHLIDGYLIPFVLYWVARHSIFEERQINLVYLLLGIFGLYLCFTAICEVTGAWSFVFPRKIADPTLGIHFGRARGPFLQSVRMGIYLLICLSATWVPLVWRRLWGRPGQLLAGVLLVIYAAAIFATYTRSVWLGLLTSAVIVVLATMQGRPRRIVLASMMASVLLIVAVAHDGLLTPQRESTTAETQQSTSMRTVFTYVSWLMIKDKPLCGFGFGHFPHEKLPYLNDRATDLHLNSIRGYIHHNSFLSIFVELGLVGFVAYLALLVAWGRSAYRLWADKSAADWIRGQGLIFLLLLVTFAEQMLFHEVSYSPMENGLLFAMAGVVSGMLSMCQSGALAARKAPAKWIPSPWSATVPS